VITSIGSFFHSYKKCPYAQKFGLRIIIGLLMEDLKKEARKNGTKGISPSVARQEPDGLIGRKD
jgi:hypothetical protein